MKKEATKDCSRCRDIKKRLIETQSEFSRLLSSYEEKPNRDTLRKLREAEKELRVVMKESESVLEKYFSRNESIVEDIELINPETKEKIGFDIEVIQKISDSEYLIGGEYGELRIYNRDTGKLSEKIEIKDFHSWINSIQRISDTKYLIVGDNGMSKKLIFKKGFDPELLPEDEEI